MLEINRIDWRKTVKTDDVNYLRAVAKKLKINFIGKTIEDLRTAVLALRSLGRKPVEHKRVGKNDDKACAKLASKTDRIKYLFVKGYHPQVISIYVSMHITNIYAALRRAGLINTGKHIAPEVREKITATVTAKYPKAGVAATPETVAPEVVSTPAPELEKEPETVAPVAQKKKTSKAKKETAKV
jgi:hypothetical protein